MMMRVLSWIIRHAVFIPAPLPLFFIFIFFSSFYCFCFALMCDVRQARKFPIQMCEISTFVFDLHRNFLRSCVCLNVLLIYFALNLKNSSKRVNKQKMILAHSKKKFFFCKQRNFCWFLVRKIRSKRF